MAEFSIQDAAFTGFRVVRAHTAALGVWALYALALSLLFGGVFVGVMGPDVMKLGAMGVQPGKDPSATLALFARLLPGYLLVMIIGLISNAVLGAAMIRAVLRPAEHRFGFMRLGADELRQLGLGLLTFAVFLGAYMALVIAFALVLAVFMAARAAPALGVVVMVAGVLAGMIFLAVRLSLAPALTFDRGRIDLFGSWSLTRGRFWPLLGTYALTVSLIGAVYLLSMLVIFAVGAVLHGGDLMAATKPPDMTSLASYFTPWRLAQTVLTAGVSALVWPVIFTPPTAIYQRLGPTAASAADMFA